MSNDLESSFITVIGMLLVALITSLFHILITRQVIKADIHKIKIQASSDFQFKNRFEWISNFRKIIAELLTTTDPDNKNSVDKHRMIFYINQAQLMLDSNKPDEKELSELITKLGTYSDYWNDSSKISEINILKIQSEITEKTKSMLNKKQFSNLKY